MEENKGNKDTNKVSPKSKRELIIVSAVLAAIAVGAYFMIPDDSDTSQTGADGERVISTGTMTTSTEQPEEDAALLDTDNPGNGSMYATGTVTIPTSIPSYTPSYIPEESDVTDPSPTLRSNNSAPPAVVARRAAQDMFSYPVVADNGIRRSITDALNMYGTERAKQEGFRPWWMGSEHTTEWELASVKGNQVINSTVDMMSEEFISNDTIKYNYLVKPRVSSPDSTTKLHDINLFIYMKNVNGEWKVDAYEIDQNTYPSFR